MFQRCRVSSQAIFALAVALYAFANGVPAMAQELAPSRVLLIVVDGLRPDYVTPAVMPHLNALGKRGMVGERNHAVFPTVTRVNSSSLTTGTYPQKHGILGNTVFFPAIDPIKGLSTADANKLMAIDQSTGGKLQMQPSLPEILKAAGKRAMVYSSGSSGSAFLMDRTVSGIGIVNIELMLPETLKAHVLETMGAVPAEATPNLGVNKYIVDAFIKLGLDEYKPDLTMMWITDPDHTAHKYGPGAPLTVESLKAVDGEIGRILSAIDERGLRESMNIIITSDHGFATYGGDPHPMKTANVTGLLISKGLKAATDSDDVVVVEGAIYVKDHDAAKIAAIVQALQAMPWVGALFTRGATPEATEGTVPGTLSFAVAHWDNERTADILVAPNWTAAENKYGFKGRTMMPGIAGHGNSSPFEIHNTLIVAGPGFKVGTSAATPTSNVDIAPTICHLLGLPEQAQMDGRVLREFLADGPDAKSVRVETRRYTAEQKWEGGSYSIEANCSLVDGHVYLDYTRARRVAELTAPK